MEQEFEFGLGDQVKDSITGFTGIIRARTVGLEAVSTYAVQDTTSLEGDSLKWKWIDGPLLKLVKKEKIKPTKDPDPFVVELGDEIKDVISKKKGIVVRITQYLTGCNRYEVIERNEMTKDTINLEEYRVKLSKKAAINSEKEEKTGGPHSADEFCTRQF